MKNWKPEDLFEREELLEWAREQDIFDIYTRQDVVGWVAESFDPDEVYESDVIIRCAAQWGDDDDNV